VPIKKTPKVLADGPHAAVSYKRVAKGARPRAPRSEEDSIFHKISESHFTLRDDGSIQSSRTRQDAQSLRRDSSLAPTGGEGKGEGATLEVPGEDELTTPNLIFSTDTPFLRLYHADCLTLLDAIAAKHPHGRFDAIFADPPYFLSNGGITCHAGRMVKVDKGDWDKSRGPELNHEFNLEWLKRCQKVLKPNGTIWVSGTHHVIFSIGYAMQQLGYKILNDIAWEKPNPPPNLSCRYFTHSTETILWAARDDKSKHVFNYQEMRKVTGKQMKTVWRREEFETRINTNAHELKPASGTENEIGENSRQFVSNLWTLGAPGSDEKTHGKHPTQKPLALIERCLLASTNPGDLVLDPFVGGGTTAIAAIRLKRGCVGVELDLGHLTLAMTRADKQIISIWLRHFRVMVNVTMAFAVAAVYDRRPEKAEAPAPAAEIGRARSPSAPQEKVKDAAPAADFGGASVLTSRPPSVFSQPSTINHQPFFDLDLFRNSINGSRVDDKPQVPTERIFHECKFVFLACAEVERGAVIHTTVDVSLQEAWAKTPTGKKRETTHIVRCETEIFRINSKT
jgi:site-specific DNA-methyltransferase (adenine-specific)